MTRALGPIILLILAIGLFFWFTKPQLAEIGELNIRVTELNDALSNAKALQDTRARLREEYNMFSPLDKEKLNKLLPDSIDNVKLIIDVDAIAAQYGMTLRNTTLESEGKSDGALGPDTLSYGAMKLSFRVSGPYAAIQRFLEDISNSLRLTDTVSLSFRSADKDMYEYDVTIKTYWLR